jgi:ADP-ribosylglycohydrolase
MFNGAVFGALYGVDSIPKEWQEKTIHFEEVKTLAEKWLK